MSGIVQYISTMKNSISTIGNTEVNYPLLIYVRFLNTGNVTVKPKISVDIRTLNDFLVDNFVYEDSEVKPGKVEMIEVDWNTTGIQTDNYKAFVNVALGDNVIYEGELSFEILPEGTLTRRGELLSLTSEGEASVGRFIKIFGVFKNTGEIPTDAMLICEIYKDEELIGVENSLESRFLVDEEDTLWSYVMIESYGDYLIKGYVTYSGKKTGVKELSFSLAEQETSPKLLIGFLAIAVVISLLIVFHRPLKRFLSVLLSKFPSHSLSCL